MKKRIIPILTVALPLFCTSVCDAYYLLRLKNRGAVTTPAYWLEGNKIHFYVSGGTASLERREIVKIENLEKEVSDYKQRTGAVAEKKEPPPLAVGKATESEKPSAEGEPKSEKSLLDQQPSRKIDLKHYQDKMAELTVNLNKTLERLREAIKNKNIEEQDKAREDNRKISAERRKLTQELKEKNNGELPPDWWAGVGK